MITYLICKNVIDLKIATNVNKEEKGQIPLRLVCYIIIIQIYKNAN